MSVQQWQVEDCVIQECTALKVFSSTCSTGLIWTLEEKSTNKGASSEVLWALLQHLTPVCWGPGLQSSIMGREVSVHNLEPCQVYLKDIREVLQSLGRAVLVFSVCRDAFLSELLCHSHQVSGVWVTKTVRRNEKSHCFICIHPAKDTNWQHFLSIHIYQSLLALSWLPHTPPLKKSFWAFYPITAKWPLTSS